MTEPGRNELLMIALEQTASAVATLSGIKKQFMNAGWEERAAEQMTLEMLRQSGAKTAK